MHSLSGIVYLGMPLENGFTGFFFSVMGERLIWSNTHTEELNWIFREWGGVMPVAWEN